MSATLCCPSQCFDCYFGTGSSYSPVTCSPTCTGIDCLCFKILEGAGIPETREETDGEEKRVAFSSSYNCICL